MDDSKGSKKEYVIQITLHAVVAVTDERHVEVLDGLQMELAIAGEGGIAEATKTAGNQTLQQRVAVTALRNAIKNVQHLEQDDDLLQELQALPPKTEYPA